MIPGRMLNVYVVLHLSFHKLICLQSALIYNFYKYEKEKLLILNLFVRWFNILVIMCILVEGKREKLESRLVVSYIIEEGRIEDKFKASTPIIQIGFI